MLGERISTAYSDKGKQTVNTFDGAGRPLEITSPSGRKQNLTYNFLGNVTQIQFKNSGGTVTETQTMTYDAYGRETATSSSQYAASTGKTYNDRGQLATESTTYSGQTYTVTYHYDAQGRPSKLTYPSGREAEYTYDDRQLLKTIKWETAQIEDRSYNDAGMLTGVDRAFVDETRTYNAGSQLTQINNTNVGSQTYTYDLNGNVTSESLSGVMANYSFSTIHAGGPFADGYDAEDRFMRFKRSGVTEDILLTRSNIGNISNVNRNGTNTARGYNTAHGLTTVSGGTTQTYDTDGNTTTLHTNVTAVWDDAGRMKNTNVPAGATAGIVGLNENGYVGGNRIWKKITRSGSVVEHRVHIHAGPNLIAEYNAGVAASTPVQEYVYAGEIDSLVLIRRSDATKYGVTRNRQWSITALHDLANGSVVERYAYEMTGKRTIYAANGTTVRSTSSFGNHFGYTNRWHDDDSGFMYFRARYYNPLTGEFLSRDPKGFIDGMSLNRGYFASDGTDPFGLQEESVCWTFDNPLRKQKRQIADAIILGLQASNPSWWNIPMVNWFDGEWGEIPDYYLPQIPGSWWRYWWKPKVVTIGQYLSDLIRQIVESQIDGWYVYFQGVREKVPCGCDLETMPKMLGMRAENGDVIVGLGLEGNISFKMVFQIVNEFLSDSCKDAKVGSQRKRNNPYGNAHPAFEEEKKCNETWSTLTTLVLHFGIDMKVAAEVKGVKGNIDIRQNISVDLGPVTFEGNCENAGKCPVEPLKPINPPLAK